MYEIAEHFCWQISLRAGRPQGPPLRQDHRFYNSGAFLQHAHFVLQVLQIIGIADIIHFRFGRPVLEIDRHARLKTLYLLPGNAGAPFVALSVDRIDKADIVAVRAIIDFDDSSACMLGTGSLFYYAAQIL